MLSAAAVIVACAFELRGACLLSNAWYCLPACSTLGVTQPAVAAVLTGAAAAAAAALEAEDRGAAASGAADRGAAADTPGSTAAGSRGSEGESGGGASSHYGGPAAGYGGATPLFPSQRYKLPPECAKHTVLYSGIYADLAGVLSARPDGITEAGTCWAWTAGGRAGHSACATVRRTWWHDLPSRSGFVGTLQERSANCACASRPPPCGADLEACAIPYATNKP